MKKLLLLALCLCSAVAFAQNEVSLVVSADGATKTEAINNALRSAIEQTYGTFVSANTQILNDKLVKDEIATVSSGNIKKYKEVAVVNLPNGSISVTLNVIVSLKKLIKYAQSKGSECEFAGETFGANLRLYEFNKKNEQLAIENMIRQLDALRPAFDYELGVSNPVLNSDGTTATVGIKIIAKANNTTKKFNEIIKETFMSLAMTEDQVRPMMEAGFRYFPCQIMIDKRDNLFTFRGNIDKYSYTGYNTYYLYNEIPIEYSLFVAKALFDFSVTDNLAGIYFNQIFIGEQSHDFGYLIGNNRDSFFRDFIPIAAASRQEYLFNRGPHVNDMKIIVFDDKLIGASPLLKYQVPLEQINLIKKIVVIPTKVDATNKIVFERNNFHIESTYYQSKD